MVVSTEYGLNIVYNVEIFKTMSKEKCPAYLEMCGDCGIDWQPCTGLGCGKDVEKYKANIVRQEKLSKLNKGKVRRMGHTKKFYEKIDNIIDIINEFDFKWIPTAKDLELIGRSVGGIIADFKYTDYLKTKTGLLRKTEYYKLHGLKML